MSNVIPADEQSSLRGALMTLLESIDGIERLPRNYPLSVERPSWEVETTGFRFSGLDIKQDCLIRIWTGLDSDPLAEGLLEHWSRTILTELIEAQTQDLLCGQPRPFVRLQPQNPLGYQAEFVVGELIVEEL